jgi:hypothetical protein
VGLPAALVTPGGETTVLWSRLDGANRVVEAATRPPGGGFAVAVPLSAPLHDGVNPAVAVSPGGRLTAVWSYWKGDSTNVVVQAASTASPPVSLVPPAIQGVAAVGKRLTCDGGSWSDAASVSIAWLRGTVEVGGGSSRTVAQADAGSTLVCRATATNPYGSVVSESLPTAIPPRPAIVKKPKARGTARVGKTLACSGARFSGATKVRYSWRRGAKSIAKATRSTYTLKAADRGKLVSCRATATGPGGTVSATSRGVRVG